jgi:L-lactate dehydrogenase (cytochrome)
VLDVVRGGIESALMGLGRASIHDLVADDILVPPGFTRALGVPTGTDG